MSPSPGTPVLPRSFLYVPGTRGDLFDKAAGGAADAVVLDLEDAVPIAQKGAARGQVAAWLDRPPTGDTTELWARVNSEALLEDLDAVVQPRLAGIFLAKCTTPSLQQTAALLEQLEAERGLAAAAIRVVGLVEGAAALLDLPTMARSARLTTFGVGETDLLADLRMIRTASTGPAIDALRCQVVTSCAAAGLSAPVAPTSTDFRDLERFTETSRHLLALGFRSRTAIHPGQVQIINEAFSPTPQAVAAARDVLARFEAAAGGVTTDVEGRLIDAAVVREARETLERAR